MRYRNAIITLCLLSAFSLSPFIGLPRSWKEGVALVLALSSALLAYLSGRVGVSTPPVVPKDMTQEGTMQ